MLSSGTWSFKIQQKYSNFTEHLNATLTSAYTHFYMWQKKLPSPWVHVIVWWMQFFRKAREFLERRGEKLTLFINSMGQTGHHEGDGPDLYPLRLSAHQPGNHETSLSYQLLGSRSKRIMNFRPALDPLQAEDQTGLCECLACPWRMFSFCFQQQGKPQHHLACEWRWSRHVQITDGTASLPVGLLALPL